MKKSLAVLLVTMLFIMIAPGVQSEDIIPETQTPAYPATGNDLDVSILEATTITVKNKTVVKLNKGDTVQLAVTGKTIINCKSSKKKVASVTKEGLLTANAEGKTKLTVTTVDAKNKKKKITVTVKVTDPTLPTKIHIDNGKSAVVWKGYPLQLTCTLDPSASESVLKWSSSNKKIAAVSNTGLVTGKKAGTAKITVETVNGKKATIKIKVMAANKTAKDLIGQWPDNDTDNQVEMGDIFSTEAVFYPLKAKGNVTWTSSNTDVAIIKSSRRNTSYAFEVDIAPVMPGKTTITATTDDGRFTRSFLLTVTTRVLPEAIVINAESPLIVKAGEEITIDYEVVPFESIFREENCATITSSDTSVATVWGVTDNGKKDCYGEMDYNLYITAKSPGKTTITVKLANGVEASIDLRVE